MRSQIKLPISVKIRLCTPPADTIRLCQQLEAAGAAQITLHARYPSAKRRRHGPAQLEHVRDLKNTLRLPVISNGNVRSFLDVTRNLEYTGADGIMAGEGILKTP